MNYVEKSLQRNIFHNHFVDLQVTPIALFFMRQMLNSSQIIFVNITTKIKVYNF